FNSLTDTERRYLKMLHDLGGAATRRTLGAEQTLTAAQMATTEQWLLNNGCIQILNADENPSGGDTEIGFGFSVSAETVATQTAIESGYETLNPPDRDQRVRMRALSPRCNQAMPRTRATCILRLGHPGGHRSR
ncbi:MAG: hypothetical protein OXB92_12700, partial [Acidimicrobiaceae bacterium]|nr:hypothetical protein [Acidimicrobiaceae bacterium]